MVLYWPRSRQRRVVEAVLALVVLVVKVAVHADEDGWKPLTSGKLTAMSRMMRGKKIVIVTVVAMMLMDKPSPGIHDVNVPDKFNGQQ